MSSVEEVLNRHIERPARRVPSLDEIRRVAFTPEVRATNEAKRTITFVASDETVDRYGDILRVNGWQTAQYMKNPVVLWGHKSSEPPVGRTLSITTESNPPALIQTVEFASKETYPFADQIFNLYKGGYLRSVSVGFRPTVPPKPIMDGDGRMTGYEFVGQELLELSCVPLPANPSAVARAVGEGVISQADAPKFFRAEIDDPELALEWDLARISIERVRLQLLELQCKDLLRKLRHPDASDGIADMAALESALRGEAN